MPKLRISKLFKTLLLISGLFVPLPGFAHAILVKSQPGKEETVKTAPKQIDLWFNDAVRGEQKALAVIDSSGKRVDNHDVEQSLTDGSHLHASVADLPAGVYTVRYRVVSEDYHIVTGKFTFTVQP